MSQTAGFAAGHSFSDRLLAPNPLHLEPQTLQLDNIDLIPPEEISEDIENMYKFIQGKL